MAITHEGLRARSKVFNALAEPRMVSGVHFSFFMLNTGVFFFVLTAFKFYWWIPVYFITHKTLGFFGKKDEILLPVYVRYTQQAPAYQSWPSPVQRMGFRPTGFGKGSFN